MRLALIILDHKQPPTPLKMDNYMTEGSVNSDMKPKHSKTWDMKGNWLRDKEFLNQLKAYFYRGTNKDADYFTTHHPPIHHCNIPPRYIHTLNLVKKIPHTIRLCESVLNQIPVTQSRVDLLKIIQAEQQFMTGKCHMVRRLNYPRKHIIYYCNSLQH